MSGPGVADPGAGPPASGTLLVLSDPGDASVRMVIDRLPRDVDVLWWDDHDLPARSSLAVSVDDEGPHPVLRTADGRRHDLGTVRVAWTRRPNRPAAAPVVTDPTQRHFCEQAARYALTGLWMTLAAHWLPAPPAVVMSVDNKLAALAAARRVGFTIPRTVVTNDPDELVGLWEALDGDVVVKAHRSESVEVAGRPRHLFTHRVTRADLLRRASVRLAPVIAQAHVTKAVEVRVTVVGDQVFAAEIHAQGSSRGGTDWRRSFGAGIRHRVHELPPAVRERCVALTRALGMTFGALDLLVDADGDHVFLEINAAGQWAWIEHETDLPISEAIAGWILAHLEEPPCP